MKKFFKISILFAALGCFNTSGNTTNSRLVKSLKDAADLHNQVNAMADTNKAYSVLPIDYFKNKGSERGFFDEIKKGLNKAKNELNKKIQEKIEEVKSEVKKIANDILNSAANDLANYIKGSLENAQKSLGLIEPEGNNKKIDDAIDAIATIDDKVEKKLEEQFDSKTTSDDTSDITKGIIELKKEAEELEKVSVEVDTSIPIAPPLNIEISPENKVDIPASPTIGAILNIFKESKKDIQSPLESEDLELKNADEKACKVEMALVKISNEAEGDLKVKIKSGGDISELSGKIEQAAVANDLLSQIRETRELLEKKNKEKKNNKKELNENENKKVENLIKDPLSSAILDRISKMSKYLNPNDDEDWERKSVKSAISSLRKLSRKKVF